MSPGSTSTAAPCLPTAFWIAATSEAHDLVGMVDGLCVMTGLPEEYFGLGLLEVTGADLTGVDLGGQGKHRGTGAVGVHNPLDQVGVAGPAAPGAHRKTAGELSFGRRREGGAFLVVHMHPVHTAIGCAAAATDRVTDRR